MKKIVYIFLVLFYTCDKENVSDCIQTEGEIIQKEYIVNSFEKILVNRDVELIISSGLEYKVIVETGANLLNDVTIEVVGDELILSDNNTCNYVREYGITKVFVTAPNLTEIRSSTQYDISSIGTLNFDRLKLLSENQNAPDSFTVGDFRLTVNSNLLSIVSNNISSFYINGNVEELNIGFFAGTSRFEGANLISNSVDVFHRGSNDITVHPVEALSGELRGTGNLITVNEAVLIDVQQYYTGRLISN